MRSRAASAAACYVGRDRLLLETPVGLADECAHADQVDHAAEALGCTDRILNRHRAGAENLLELVDRHLEVGALAIHAADEGDHRQRQLGGAGPQLFGFDAQFVRRRRQHEDHAGAGAHAVERVGQEVGVPGRVDQRDLVLLPRQAVQRRGQRGLAADLLGLEVEHRRAVVDASQARRRAGGEEQRVGQGGLPDAALARRRRCCGPASRHQP